MVVWYTTVTMVATMVKISTNIPKHVRIRGIIQNKIEKSSPLYVVSSLLSAKSFLLLLPASSLVSADGSTHYLTFVKYKKMCHN